MNYDKYNLIPLSDAIEAVKREVERTQDANRGRNLDITITELELNLLMIFKSEPGGGRYTEAVVINPEHIGENEPHGAHRIRLKLEFLDSSGGQVSISAGDIVERWKR